MAKGCMQVQTYLQSVECVAQLDLLVLYLLFVRPAIDQLRETFAVRGA